MAEFKPTESQRNAIESRGRSLLVSAGAGSGKTRVLTERLLGYVAAEGSAVDIDSFVVITFTRAAAAELRGRILQAINDEIRLQPDNQHLRRQSALVSKAMICTIDSFCMALLREFGSGLDTLPPDFKVLDDTRAAAMQREVVDRLLTACYEDTDAIPGFRQLVDSIGTGHNDEKLADLILELHEKMQCHAYPEKWADDTLQELSRNADDMVDTAWGKYLLGSAVRNLNYQIRQMQSIASDAEADPVFAGKNRDSFAAAIEGLIALRDAANTGWDALRSAPAVNWGKLSTQKCSKDFSDRIKDRKGDCKKGVDKILAGFSLSSADTLAALRETAPMMSALLILTKQFSADYREEKLRSGLADFSDLSHETVRMLLDPETGKPTELAQQIAARYTEVMVDEFQDVSQVQDTIFNAVSRSGKNLFFVGDAKQSIYRFRLADPGLFIAYSNHFSPYASAAPGESARIDLQENFRSRREILDACNAVFSRCMSAGFGDIEYDETAALKYGAGYEGTVPVPEILLLDLPDKKAELSADDTRQTMEARMVANKIRQLVDGGATVSGQNGQRPVTYGDIAVLFRSANVTGKPYRKVFEEYGIPVSSAQPGGFFTSAEVTLLVSLLSILDNPHQDIPLLSVLQSPAFRFSPDELAVIRLADKHTDYCTALQKAAPDLPKAADFLEKLDRFRDLAPDLRMCDLIWQLITELDLAAIFSAMPGGSQRLLNLTKFIDLSERFEQSGYRGLHRFVLWLRQLSVKDDIVVPDPAGVSAVTMLSVHKSKGLEFPIVFVCDTGKTFNRQDSQEAVLIHPTYGLGPSFTDFTRKVRYPTAAKTAIAKRLTEENDSEEMRLLYVAMTRAKERLFLTGAMKKAADTWAGIRQTWAGRIKAEPQELSKAACYAKWLLFAAAMDGQEHMTVTIAAPETFDSASAATAAAANADPGILKELQRRLDYRYPWQDAETLPSKVTATELKHREEPDPDAAPMVKTGTGIFRRPDFDREAHGLTGAERGVATHLVLQYLDFSKVRIPGGIEAEVKRLAEARFLTPAQAAAVDRRAISGLFTSPLGIRMLHAFDAGLIRREFKFSILCPAKELLAGKAAEKRIPETDEVLLQGVVDCFLEEEGELTVIDYKTDKVPSEDALQARTALYSGQLNAYAGALRRICGKPVREGWLYFLDRGKAVKVF